MVVPVTSCKCSPTIDLRPNCILVLQKRLFVPVATSLLSKDTGIGVGSRSGTLASTTEPSPSDDSRTEGSERLGSRANYGPLHEASASPASSSSASQPGAGHLPTSTSSHNLRKGLKSRQRRELIPYDPEDRVEVRLLVVQLSEQIYRGQLLLANSTAAAELCALLAIIETATACLKQMQIPEATLQHVGVPAAVSGQGIANGSQAKQGALRTSVPMAADADINAEAGIDFRDMGGNCCGHETVDCLTPSLPEVEETEVTQSTTSSLASTTAQYHRLAALAATSVNVTSASTESGMASRLSRILRHASPPRPATEREGSRPKSTDHQMEDEASGQRSGQIGVHKPPSADPEERSEADRSTWRARKPGSRRNLRWPHLLRGKSEHFLLNYSIIHPI
ncbi:unnamed protein product [Protopolystoma xenopodis]|uniref:Uncharacterized protein n=1 Tax=Protopolystoma xenopodis TaxID=117903 RepID=A0A3S4ZP49_9PLAT|nr:unnamed protein product [Protopolystoma xenopodis]